MEIFVLAALTSFLLTSAITALEQPENFRTSTVAYYFGGSLVLGIVALFVILGPSSQWLQVMMGVVGAAAMSMVLGFCTGVCVFLVWEGQTQGHPNRPTLLQVVLQVSRAMRKRGWISHKPMSNWLAFLLVASALNHICALLILGDPVVGFVWSVSSWVLTTIAGLLITIALRSADQPRNTQTSSLYALGILSLFAVIFLFLARTTDWFDFWKTQISYRVSGREMLDLVAGAAFGWLVRRWMQHWYVAEETSGYVWACGVLLAIPLFASIAPHFSALVTSVTGLKTPFAELQFSPSRTESRAAFDVARDRYSFQPASLVDIETAIDRDRRYATILTTLQEELPVYLKSDNASPSITAQAQTLHEQFKPLIRCLEIGAQEMADPREIEDALRPSASALSLLVRDLSKIRVALEEEVSKGSLEKSVLQSQCKKDEPKLYERKKRLIEALEETRGKIAKLVTDEKCPDKLREPMRWPSDIDAACQSQGPHIYYLAAGFQVATRNLDRAIDILEEVVKDPAFREPPHPSLNFLLATISYYGDRAFDDVLHYTMEALTGVSARTKMITRASKKDSKSNTKEALAENAEQAKALKSLQDWAPIAETRVKNLFAYVAAQAGQYEIMAERFASENYKKLDPMASIGDVSPMVLNIYDRLTFIDTYAYVLMAIGARKSPVDANAIHLAHRLFVEAKSIAKRLPSRDRGGVEVTIEAHLRQAEKLLVQIK